MNYYEIRIYTATEGIDAVSGMLTALGHDTFVIEDKSTVEELLEKKNAYDWDYVDETVIAQQEMESNITLYMEYDENAAGAVNAVRSAVETLKKQDEDGLFGRLETEVSIVCDDEWKDRWKEYFKPARITDDIVIKPTWEEYEAAAGDTVIELDPGMAFGTGTHPTTVMCVKYLERYIVSGADVLDIGCGSGILSIVSALCGAGSVRGVDIDPNAVEASIENARLNGLEDSIEILQGDITVGFDFEADVIAANLMADLIIMLSRDIAAHLRRGGIFISSGILTEKRREVIEAIEASGFEIADVMKDGEWCAVAARLR